MGVIKRSIVSITQRVWKSLILLFVVFILGNVIAASVTVRDATKNVEVSMKERLGAYVSLDMNEEYFMQESPDMSEFNFSRALADKIGKDERVRDFSYSLQHSVGSDDLQKHEEDMEGEQFMMFTEEHSNLFDFNLLSDKNGTPNDAKSEKIKIKEGRFPTAQDSTENPYVVTVSKEVAEKNNLKIGDMINLKSGVMDMGDASSGSISMGTVEILETFEQQYEIIGVFETKDVKTDNPMDKLSNQFLKNTMYTSLEASSVLDDQHASTQVKHNKGNKEDYTASVSPTYILNSVDDLELFVKDYEAELPKAYLFSSSQDTFNSVASSITNMNNLSSNVYYFGIVISIVILTLIIVLFLRERKTEFGIYQALGESKAKTMIQIGLEVMIITVVGVSLALFTGSKIAEKVSTQMIETQLLADEQNDNGFGMATAISIGGNEVSMPKLSKAEVMESYTVEVTQQYIIAFYTVMLSASLIATLLSTGYILRLKPREILL